MNATAPKKVVPAWVEQLSMKFNSGIAHTFIITGNVRDQVDVGKSLELYLAGLFMANPEVVYDIFATYDRANGLTFQAGRERFMALVRPQEETGNSLQDQLLAKRADEELLPTEPLEVFALMEKALRAPRGKQHCAFIIKFAESIFPAGEWASLSPEDRNCIVKLNSWAKHDQIQKNANPVILITDTASKLHESVTSSSSGIEQIEILLPSPDERLAYIQAIQKQAFSAGKPFTFAKSFDERKMATLTSSLSRLKLEDIALQAETQGQAIGPELVKERKRDIISQEYQGVLENMEAERGFESIGGKVYLKKWFQVNVIIPMLAGDFRRVPQGLCFVGPPGTGKTWFARALAKESGMNMMGLNVGKLMSKFIGDSEANMARVGLAFRSNVPCICWLDEADQQIDRGGDGDNGVAKRLFGMLLELMGDPRLRGRVLFILATNRPDLMDPAMKRTGRIDEWVPFLRPSRTERAHILTTIAGNLKLNLSVPANGINTFTDKLDKWVQSDIESLLVKAYRISKGDKVTMADLEQARSVIVPSTGEYELWEKLALREVRDMELLPEDIRKNYDRADIDTETKRLIDGSATIAVDTVRKGRGRAI